MGPGAQFKGLPHLLCYGELLMSEARSLVHTFTDQIGIGALWSHLRACQ